MTLSDKDVKRHLKLGEDSDWEFKSIEFRGNRPVGPERDVWADEIAAFANTRGGAILCGVADDGQIPGMSKDQMDEMEKLLAEICNDTIKPSVLVHISRREPEEDKAILLVEVLQGDAVHESPGGCFHRVGSSKRKMNSEETLRLAQRRGQAQFRGFDMQPVSNTGFGTLTEALWKPLLSAEGATDPKTALEKQTLLAPDESGIVRATVAGVLLCSEHPEEWLPNASITAVHYRGTDRPSGQIDAQEITGPLDQQVSAAVKFVIRNMSVTARKTPERADLPQYSERAVFEALVNAVAHRDYTIRGSRIRLSMFEDRLEIQSPGDLPNSLTIENLGSREATRNEALVSMLRRMPVSGIHGSENRVHLMDRRGDGVPIIQRETMQLCGQPPIYKLIDNAELLLVLPAAPQKESPVRTAITVCSGGTELAGVDILALFPNCTWQRATTNAQGQAHLHLHSSHLPMTVFAAAPSYAACIEHGWVPTERPLALEMSPLPGGGAIIFPEDTGILPGLRGQLNPIRDPLNRTYLYASNIAINEGRTQPVYFLLGEEVRLTDTDGNERWARIIDIAGRSALVEYRARPSSATQK